MRNRTRLVLAALFVLYLSLVHAPNRLPVAALSVSVDDVASVLHVYDGDTFNTSKGWTIRLADIDAPENLESGYNASKAYVIALVQGRDVFLDVDPLLDPYDRYVCLAYIRHNTTHLLNVNQDLVLAGHAVVQNYTNNQFNPEDWTHYVYYPIDQASKLPSSISCLVQNSEVPMGSTLTVSGLILPTPSLSYGLVTLTYTPPDDTILNRTVPIMSDGSYGDLYAPRIVGEWQVTASWGGSTSLEGAISATRTFTVTVARIDIPLEYIALGLLCGVIIFLLYIRRR
jgi:endonuclease YncB( thermonuclease family)